MLNINIYIYTVTNMFIFIHVLVNVISLELLRPPPLFSTSFPTGSVPSLGQKVTQEKEPTILEMRTFTSPDKRENRGDVQPIIKPYAI